MTQVHHVPGSESTLYLPAALSTPLVSTFQLFILPLCFSNAWSETRAFEGNMVRYDQRVALTRMRVCSNYK